MRISSTRLSIPSAPQKPSSAPAGEKLSFHNEPHVPMDAVMRGFSQIELSSSTKETLSITAIGALGGAIGAALGGGDSAIPMTALTTAGIGATAAAAHSMASSEAGYSIPGALLTGIGFGGFAGILGNGLTSLTGLPPIISGAIAGAGMGYVSSVVMKG